MGPRKYAQRKAAVFAKAEDGVGRPSLSTSDVHERVREAAFALLFANREPVEIDRLRAIAGVRADRMAPLLDALGGGGWIDRDADGRLTGSAGHAPIWAETHRGHAVDLEDASRLGAQAWAGCAAAARRLREPRP